MQTPFTTFSSTSINTTVDSVLSETQQKISNCLYSAISGFNEKESYLIENDLSERCICARFAIHLQEALKQYDTFEKYFVDVEYNRGYHGKNSGKKMLNDAKIVLDLIVHTRDRADYTGFDNLICIEMKKSNARKKDIEDDKDRLKKLIASNENFHYHAAFMIIINSSELDHTLTIDTAYYRSYTANESV